MEMQTAAVDIPADVHAAAAARAVVEALLPVWDLVDLQDDAKLIATELITNAYRHAPGTDSFELELVRRGRGVRISLADGSSVLPIIAKLSHDATGGRGMVLVAALATAWGAEKYQGGKRVWVDLDQTSPALKVVWPSDD